MKEPESWTLSRDKALAEGKLLNLAEFEALKPELGADARVAGARHGAGGPHAAAVFHHLSRRRSAAAPDDAASPPTQRMTSRLRTWLSQIVYTPNTIRYRVEWRRLREALEITGPVEHLFDGGAGSGEFARKILAEGRARRVTALEFDAGNFACLQAKLGRDPRVTLHQGSLLDIPCADESFDLVQSTQVIEHIEDHETAARELIRVLKPGGHALITVPHPPEPFPNEGHVREGYTEAALRELFEPLGCRLKHTDYCLTRGTVKRMMAVERLPLRGLFVPVALVDAEKHLTAAERRADTPFGILALFQKA
jgi:ubiquinone/menaquinone biosynthesis C-methylase UbiE